MNPLICTYQGYDEMWVVGFVDDAAHDIFNDLSIEFLDTSPHFYLYYTFMLGNLRICIDERYI